jgi:hypothetical protein
MHYLVFQKKKIQTSELIRCSYREA